MYINTICYTIYVYTINYIDIYILYIYICILCSHIYIYTHYTYYIYTHTIYSIYTI